MVPTNFMFDKELHKEYILCSYLAKLLPSDKTQPFDLDNRVKLEYYHLEKTYEGAIELEAAPGSWKPTQPKRAGGQKDRLSPLDEIIARINEEFFGDFTDADRVMVDTLYSIKPSMSTGEGFHSKRGSVHLYKLPLSLPELLDELQPVSLACIKVTCRAKRSGHIVVFHDIVRQVWGNSVSLLAGQIVHRSLILVVQHENLGNQLQLLHFGRIAAILLDVGQIGRSNPYHFRHLAERDLFLCAFPLKELSKILVLCVHVVHLFYFTL